MKTAAEILGVSYGTLYGRYRDSYGCLKHPYRYLKRSIIYFLNGGNGKRNRLSFKNVLTFLFSLTIFLDFVFSFLFYNF